jgi:hypothetical protein
MAAAIEPYVIENDPPEADKDTAKWRITNDSYNVFHPVNSVTDGINSPIFVVGVPYWTRWLDYQVYTEQARDDLNDGLMASLGSVTIVDATGYLMTGMSCTESLFVGDSDPIQVWRYHMEFVKSADLIKAVEDVGGLGGGGGEHPLMVE